MNEPQFAREEANFQNCVRISVKAVGHTQESPKEQSVLRTASLQMTANDGLICGESPNGLQSAE